MKWVVAIVLGLSVLVPTGVQAMGDQGCEQVTHQIRLHVGDGNSYNALGQVVIRECLHFGGPGDGEDR